MACGTYFAEPDTILVFNIFYGEFGGGTRLAMSKTICTPDSSSLKAWFRGYYGSPGLGGLRIARLSQLAGLLRYKIEDFVSCPDGTLLDVEGELGNTDMHLSSFVTDFV